MGQGLSLYLSLFLTQSLYRAFLNSRAFGTFGSSHRAYRVNSPELSSFRHSKGVSFQLGSYRMKDLLNSRVLFMQGSSVCIEGNLRRWHQVRKWWKYNENLLKLLKFLNPINWFNLKIFWSIHSASYLKISIPKIWKIKNVVSNIANWKYKGIDQPGRKRILGGFWIFAFF